MTTEHQQPIPFDDALRKMLKAPPPSKKPKAKKPRMKKEPPK